MKEKKKKRSPDVFSGVKNALAAEAHPRTPLRELTALPRPLNWTNREEGRNVGKGRGWLGKR